MKSSHRSTVLNKNTLMEQQDKREAAAPKVLRFAPVFFWVAWERSPAHICLHLILVGSGVESGVFTMACCVEVRRKSCETVGELRISMISFAVACRLALRSER